MIQFIEKNEMDEKVLNQSLKFRKDFGLKYDKELVMGLNISRKAFEKSGHYLTEEEYEMLKQRFEKQSMRHELENIIKNSDKDNNFSGSWIDQENGGIIKLGFKDINKLPKETKELVKKAYGDPEKIDFYEVKFSNKELKEIHNELRKEKPKLKELGINIVQSKSDFPNQKVQIVLSEYIDEKAEIIKNALKNHKSVEVVEGSFKVTDQTHTGLQEWRYTTGKLQGGTTISINTINEPICTGAFSVKNSNGYYYVTAGHCLNYGDLIFHDSMYKGEVTSSYDIKNSGALDVV